MSKREVIFEIEEPKEIWYADKPPRLGGIPRKLSISEFQSIYKKPFRYSEQMWSEVHNPFFGKIQGMDSFRKNVIFYLKNPKAYWDKLVICYINDEVGFGVFTREKINLGEIVCFYSGVFRKNNLDDNEFNEYGMDVDTATGESDYFIDAGEIGRIARFIQHLPDSIELDFKTLSSARKNPKQLAQLLRLEYQSEEDILEIIQQQRFNPESEIPYDVYKKMSQNKDPMKGWHLDSIKLLNPEQPRKIACSNLTAGTVIFSGKPIVFLAAQRDIMPGSQLGFDYKGGYWIQRGMMPEVFQSDGQILPREVYRYTRLGFSRKDENKQSKMFFYSREEYEKASERCAPVQTTPLSCPVSFFEVRKKLVKNNVLSSSYATIEGNLLVYRLRKYWTSELGIEIEVFFQDPDSENYEAHAVCKVADIKRWAQLTSWIRNSDIKNYCKCYQFSKEIVIKWINSPDRVQKMFSFVDSVQKINWPDFFESTAVLVPDEYDAKSLFMADPLGGYKIL